MARLARVVLPGYPHHITQRGNRRQDVFFTDGDYEHYLELLVEWCAYEGIEIWDYRWSSVHAHFAGEDSRGIILPEKLLSLAGDWKTYLQESQGSSGIEFEQHGRMGRPLGSERFIEKAGCLLQRDLKKKKPGPKGDRDIK